MSWKIVKSHGLIVFGKTCQQINKIHFEPEIDSKPNFLTQWNVIIEMCLMSVITTLFCNFWTFGWSLMKRHQCDTLFWWNLDVTSNSTSDIFEKEKEDQRGGSLRENRVTKIIFFFLDKLKISLCIFLHCHLMKLYPLIVGVN